MKQNNQPFRRAIVMMAAIQAAMMENPRPGLQQRMALEAIGPYESRGKGEGRSNRRAPGAGKAARRAAMKRRNVIRHRKACRG